MYVLLKQIEQREIQNLQYRVLSQKPMIQHTFPMLSVDHNGEEPKDPENCQITMNYLMINRLRPSPYSPMPTIHQVSLKEEPDNPKGVSYS